MKETIAIFDLSMIFWHYYEINKANNSDSISDCVRQTVDLITNIADDYDYAAIAVDYPPYTRKDVYPEYKSNRGGKDPVGIDFLEGVKTKLSDRNYQLLAVKGAEADDCIATAAKLANYKGLEVTVFGTDKDLLQIPNIKLYEPFKRQEKTPEDVLKVDQELVISFQSLTGDTSDHIPGVPGVGPKSAIKILERIGCVENLLKDVTLADQFPEKTANLIKENIGNIETSMMLVTLVENLPIELELKKVEDIVRENAKPIVSEPDAEPKTSPVVVEQTPVKTKNDLIKVDHRNGSWALQLEPDSNQRAECMAQALFDSNLFKFNNAQGVFAVILRGRALGLDATTALSNFHIIEGKLGMYASLIVGLIVDSGKAFYFDCIETDMTKATWITKRRNGSGREIRLTYTIEEAEQAGLLRETRSGTKSNWHSRPKTMLRWRAATELARMVYPEITTGLYTPDEIQEGVTLHAE